ncbi:oxidoreductase [Pseudovirgaria hyperparasitica]|uniref:Oxidoreductase n=1 Tax=Pseudovirgaria hyperparasitica TaxID=470096 RepID=A0A6A6WJY2_9PEZI|nr:oxidoreductase [Pseudovirgaria hyperparasitica]KAF2762357.1 oxidoreductase [Pseudovirgaria hyperparasitica]
MDLLTLDMAKFHGTKSEQREFSNQFLQGLTDAGFVKLVNHGLTEEDMTMLFKQSASMFTLPKEEKEKFANVKGPKPQRGWSHPGAESTATLNLPGTREINDTTISMDMVDNVGRTDLKEHFDMGPVGDPEFPNVYPSNSAAPGFQSWMEKYFEKGQQLSLDLMRALEVAMELPKDALVDRCEGHASEIRMIHYPETPLSKLADGKLMPIWPHTDFGILTLLAQGTSGGLEIEDKNVPGGYLPVPLVDKTELLINVGDTLERWTNGRVQAGLHQVTVPSDVKGEVFPERYSVAFFLKANRATSAGPIPLFVPEGTTSKYKEMTALQYHAHRTAIMYY